MTPERALLPAQWRAKADVVRPFNPGAAFAYEECAREREAEIAGQANQVVTLTEAAALSGYHADSLRHKLATGEIENVGRKHAPRVRIADLPRKAGRVAASAYDPQQDALRLLSPQGGR